MDKHSLFSIGDIAKIFHISAGSIRHYETLGILKPEYIDPCSNYRYYSARQFEILNTVRYLRALDMPLTQIADFLRNRDVDVIENKLLMQKKKVIEKKIELEKIENKINNRLDQIKNARSSELDQIKLVKAPECRLILIKGSLILKSTEEIEKTVSKLSEYGDEPVVFLGKVGFGISEEHLKEQSFKKYDCVFLVLDNEDTYTGKTEYFPEALCVSIRFRGVHTDAVDYYNRLIEYIHNNNMEIAGFSREITLIDFGMTTDTEKFVTEIKIPIKLK